MAPAIRGTVVSGMPARKTLNGVGTMLVSACSQLWMLKTKLGDRLTGEEWVDAGYTNILNFEAGIKSSH